METHFELHLRDDEELLSDVVVDRDFLLVVLKWFQAESADGTEEQIILLSSNLKEIFTAYH